MVNVDELEKSLVQFTGTEEWHRWSVLFRNALLTDGTKYLAETAGAYWLMDIIASWNKTDDKVMDEYFQVWRLEVHPDHSATITATDGNDNEIARQEIEYTDFPLQEIELYASNEDDYIIIMLKSEN